MFFVYSSWYNIKIIEARLKRKKRNNIIKMLYIVIYSKRKRNGFPKLIMSKAITNIKNA